MTGRLPPRDRRLAVAAATVQALRQQLGELHAGHGGDPDSLHAQLAAVHAELARTLDDMRVLRLIIRMEPYRGAGWRATVERNREVRAQAQALIPTQRGAPDTERAQPTRRSR